MLLIFFVVEGGVLAWIVLAGPWDAEAIWPGEEERFHLASLQAFPVVCPLVLSSSFYFCFLASKWVNI